MLFLALWMWCFQSKILHCYIAFSCGSLRFSQSQYFLVFLSEPKCLNLFSAFIYMYIFDSTYLYIILFTCHVKMTYLISLAPFSHLPPLRPPFRRTFFQILLSSLECLKYSGYGEYGQGKIWKNPTLTGYKDSSLLILYRAHPRP